MRDIRGDTVEKIYVCSTWGGIPIYIINANKGGIPDEDIGFSIQHRRLYERWKGKELQTLIRFGFLQKPRIYSYPEKWFLDLEIQRTINNLKVHRNKLSIANREPKPNAASIQDLTKKVSTIDRQLKCSLAKYLNQKAEKIIF